MARESQKDCLLLLLSLYGQFGTSGVVPQYIEIRRETRATARALALSIFEFSIPVRGVLQKGGFVGMISWNLGACAMTTKFLDNKICTFNILLS